MRKILVASAVLALAAASPALASQSERSNPSSCGAIGNAVSDVFYGNEPNVAPADNGPADANATDPGSVAGDVSGSQSPGPWVNNPNDPDSPTRGSSLGFYASQGLAPGQACQAAS